MDFDIQPTGGPLEEEIVEERQRDMLNEAKKQAIIHGEVEPSEETDEAYEPVVQEDLTIADVQDDEDNA